VDGDLTRERRKPDVADDNRVLSRPDIGELEGAIGAARGDAMQLGNEDGRGGNRGAVRVRDAAGEGVAGGWLDQ